LRRRFALGLRTVRTVVALVAAFVAVSVGSGGRSATTIAAAAPGVALSPPRAGGPGHHVAASPEVPPQNPSQSLPPSPNFTDDGNCEIGALDDSSTCLGDVAAAIGDGRSTLEGMPPLSLNLGAFAALTVPEQLFVITDLERVDRGLAPVSGMTNQLDAAAQSAADANDDPELSSATLTGGATVTGWGSVWAGGTSNALGSDYYWMYDDGVGSPNSACATASSPGCWGHRDNLLGTFASSATCGSSPSEQYLGAGDTASGSSYGPSFAEIIAGACGPTPSDAVFTWAQAQQDLGGGSTPPAVPQDVAAAAGARHTVVLTWQAPADDGGSAITGYEVTRGRSARAQTPYRKVTCTASQCRFVNHHVGPKRLFFYTVAAMNAQGTGPPSDPVSG